MFINVINLYQYHEVVPSKYLEDFLAGVRNADNVRDKWAEVETDDPCIREGKSIFEHYILSLQFKDVTPTFYERQLKKIKRLCSILSGEEEIIWQKGAFIWFERVEKPMIEIEDILLSFAKKASGTLIKNYRDNLLRVIAWKNNSYVPVVVINEIYDQLDEKVIPYVLSVKLFDRHKGFWGRSVRYDTQGVFEKDLAVFETPINREGFVKILNQACEVLANEMLSK
jgi:hypothetical protein